MKTKISLFFNFFFLFLLLGFGWFYLTAMDECDKVAMDSLLRIKGYEAGNDFRRKMFECRFENSCVSSEIDRVAEESCRYLEKYTHLDSKDCNPLFKKEFEQSYAVNKQMFRSLIQSVLDNTTKKAVNETIDIATKTCKKQLNKIANLHEQYKARTERVLQSAERLKDGYKADFKECVRMINDPRRSPAYWYNKLSQ